MELVLLMAAKLIQVLDVQNVKMAFPLIMENAT
jgi:hypothetical protein